MSDGDLSLKEESSSAQGHPRNVASIVEAADTLLLSVVDVQISKRAHHLTNQDK